MIQLGNLYINESSNQPVEQNPEVVETRYLCDRSSGNYHMVPKEQLGTIEKSIDEMLKRVFCILEGQNIGKNWPPKRIYPSSRSNMTGKDLFQCIRVTNPENGTRYELMCVRFYIEDDRVNCILKSFQFCRQPDIKSFYAYPNSKEPDVTKAYRVPDHIYYNPETPFKENDITQTADSIANKFIKFVNDYL